MMSNNANARFDNDWKVLNRESGCSSLSSIQDEYPYLLKSKTPQEIFSSLKLKYFDAKLTPFLDILEDERRESKEPATKEELEFFKYFTKKNALHLSSIGGGVELILVTNELCKRIIP